MSSFFIALDFFWKLSVIMALSSTALLGAFLLAKPLLQKISGRAFNHAARAVILSLWGIFLLSGVLLLTVDQDLQGHCFGTFIGAQKVFGWTRCLALIWSAGVLGFAFFETRRYRHFARRMAESCLKKNQLYILMPNHFAPMTFGVFRSFILVPQKLAEDSRRLKHVLAHEQTHIKNRDSVWSLLSLGMERICWFNPLTFLFERSRRLAMEMATDENALRNYSLNLNEYTRTLIDVAEMFRNRDARSFCLGVSSDFHEMRLRLESLQNQAKRPKSCTYKILAVAILVGGWYVGLGESLAYIQVRSPQKFEEIMCYQVEHEKLLESWLKTQPETNKCE